MFCGILNIKEWLKFYFETFSFFKSLLMLNIDTSWAHDHAIAQKIGLNVHQHCSSLKI